MSINVIQYTAQWHIMKRWTALPRVLMEPQTPDAKYIYNFVYAESDPYLHKNITITLAYCPWE